MKTEKMAEYLPAVGRIGNFLVDGRARRWGPKKKKEEEKSMCQTKLPPPPHPRPQSCFIPVFPHDRLRSVFHTLRNPVSEEQARRCLVDGGSAV
jgi:hypothetical protein